jgi:hypothetical protein
MDHGTYLTTYGQPPLMATIATTLKNDGIEISPPDPTRNHKLTVDSGCVHNCTGNNRIFQYLKFYDPQEQAPILQVANKHVLRATGWGYSNLTLTTNKGSKITVCYHFLYLPEFQDLILLSTECTAKQLSTTGPLITGNGYSNIGPLGARLEYHSLQHLTPSTIPTVEPPFSNKLQRPHIIICDTTTGVPRLTVTTPTTTYPQTGTFGPICQNLQVTNITTTDTSSCSKNLPAPCLVVGRSRPMQQDQYKLLHSMYAHRDIDYLCSIFKLTKPTTKFFCVDCAVGKLTRQPVPLLPTTATKPGD